MKLFITGGAGFIGSNFIKHILNKYQDYEVVNFDKLTYAGNLENLRDIENNSRYKFVKGDICDKPAVTEAAKGCDAIVNFAAESHNSYAVINPTIFFQTNLIGTQTLLEAARKNNIPRFHHISTCEVYGDLPLDSEEKFTESHPLRPRTPYNASKAASDLAVMAYFETFGLPVTISRCSNNFGPYQFPEKLISLFITNLMDGKNIPLYRQSRNKREWLYVDDHCSAIDSILHKGRIGEIYNIGSGTEKSVEEISDALLQEIGASPILKEYVDDRPGHDRRYLLDSSKIRNELGWMPQVIFEDGLHATVEWYKNHRSWWEPLRGKRPVDEAEWNSVK